MNNIKIGDKILLTNTDYEEYEELKDKELTVSFISKNINDHPGYDESVGGLLIDCEEIEFSLYEWEFEKI